MPRHCGGAINILIYTPFVIPCHSAGRMFFISVSIGVASTSWVGPSFLDNLAALFVNQMHAGSLHYHWWMRRSGNILTPFLFRSINAAFISWCVFYLQQRSVHLKALFNNVSTLKKSELHNIPACYQCLWSRCKSEVLKKLHLKSIIKCFKKSENMQVTRNTILISPFRL